MAKEQVDAVVVGSGAAGSLIAAKLSQAGKKVLILEGGPADKGIVDQLPDLVPSAEVGRSRH